jgi:hypothetical protein
MLSSLLVVVALVLASTNAFRMGGSIRTMHNSARSDLVMKDFPKPNVENTDNYRIANELSAKFKTLNGKGPSKTVAIIGGGLSGLACARYLVDAGITTHYTYLTELHI